MNGAIGADRHVVVAGDQRVGWFGLRQDLPGEPVATLLGIGLGEAEPLVEEARLGHPVHIGATALFGQRARNPIVVVDPAGKSDSPVPHLGEGLEELAGCQHQVALDVVELVADRGEIGEHDMLGVAPEEGDLGIVMPADGDHARGALQQGRFGQQVGVVDFDGFDLQRLAAAFDAEPQADIVGVDEFLVGAQEMHQRDLVEALAVGPVAGPGRGVVHRLGGLDDRLPFLGGDRERLVEIQHPADRGGRHADSLGDFLQRDHRRSRRPPEPSVAKSAAADNRLLHSLVAVISAEFGVEIRMLVS